MENNYIYILHIESSTDVCAVALSRDNEYIHHVEESGTMQHAGIITLLIQQLLKEANLSISELDAVSLSEGPGSYTSLRVGMSVAKGICYGRDIPLIAINTLDAMALETKQREPECDLICSMIDARRMEVYASLYDENMNLLLDNEPIVLESDSFDKYLENGRSIVFCGNGITKSIPVYESKKVLFSIDKTDARFLIKPAYQKYQKGDFADLAYFSPNYIKSPNITLAKKKLL